MTNLSVIPFSFENHRVRTIVINDEPWFIASDICSALKIANVSDALYKLDDDEKLHLGLTEAQKIDKMAREINIISESGMFTLVLRSRDAVKQGTLPHRFRKWVTGEVLPAIRKSGRYETLQYSQQNREPLDNNDIANLRWLIRCVTARFKFQSGWNAAIWHALRQATGTPSPFPFSVEDIPVLTDECRRILTITSQASELICQFEKDVMRKVVRDRNAYEAIACKVQSDFDALQITPRGVQVLRKFEEAALLRLQHRHH